MKKLAYLFMIMAVALGFTACDKESDEPKFENKEVALGFYILNQGNMSTKLPGSITIFNAQTGQSNGEDGNAFLDVNGIQIGEEANQMLICANRMFITVSTSNIIWCVDPASLKVLGSIRPTGEATTPRFMATANGRLYVSMYTGYVCEIDPLNLTITRTVKVGPNPEQMGVIGNTLVVTNSDGQNWAADYANCSLSFVDLKTFTQTELKDYNTICNPTKCVSNGNDLFIICMGNYKDIPAKVKKVKGKTIADIEDVCAGTLMDINGKNLYVINSPFGGELNDISYKVYDTASLENKGDFIKMESGNGSWIDFPAGAYVNPLNSEIVVLSYKLDANGWAQFTAPCYANIYDKEGNFKSRIPCGVCATDVMFINAVY